MSNRLWSPDVVAIGDRLAALTAAAAAELSAYLETAHGIRAAAAPVVERNVEPDVVIDRRPAEPTEFDVVLEGYDSARRVGVIRTVRELLTLGLKEARDAVDAAPKVLKEGLPRA